jgi:NAD(P)H dehydrogenase (quinone)
MSVIVTGATGHLGRLAVESLLKRGVPAEHIVAAGRKVDTIDDLAARGVQVRHVDFDRPETLGAVFTAAPVGGATQLLLVSGSELGQRIAQHRNVVDAAKAAGVGLIVYTSAPHADTTPMLLAAEHRATEEIIRTSGLPFVMLRNDWYFEVYTEQIPTYLAQGEIVGSAGEGRVSAAARADYAEAAAVVLTTEGHAGKVYELAGDAAFTQAELADEVSRQSGQPVTYRNVPLAETKARLLGFGLPEEAATVIADIDRAVAAGELYVTSGDLGRLIGRPTTSLSQAVADAL